MTTQRKSKTVTITQRKSKTVTMPVLTHVGKNYTRTVYVLEKGDKFPNFGGSSHALIAGGSASIVIRTLGHEAGTVDDLELSLDSPQFWTWVAGIMDKADGGTTRAGGDDLLKV